jgi:hypothetical protein
MRLTPPRPALQAFLSVLNTALSPSVSSRVPGAWDAPSAEGSRALFLASGARAAGGAVGGGVGSRLGELMRSGAAERAARLALARALARSHVQQSSSRAAAAGTGI